MMFDSAQNILRFQGHARAPDAIALADFHDQASDCGMEMKMLVRVDVIQAETGGGKGRELRFDLGFQLAAHLGQEEHRRPSPRHVGAEIAVGVHQVWHLCGRQNRLAFYQHQMQADPQRWQGFGTAYRIVGGGARHHQAGGGENAVFMAMLHGFVDRFGSAEIVRRDDKLLHCLRRRSCLRGGAGTGRTPRLRADGAPAYRAT